jgi:hypothetical protein
MARISCHRINKQLTRESLKEIILIIYPVNFSFINQISFDILLFFDKIDRNRTSTWSRRNLDPLASSMIYLYKTKLLIHYYQKSITETCSKMLRNQWIFYISFDKSFNVESLLIMFSYRDDDFVFQLYKLFQWRE